MKKKYLLITTLLFCITVFSQENANSSFDISLKNSIKFNKYLINPAFSFAKETAPTLTIVNRRQWVDFENAPQFYFANYLGRLSNRSRFGIGIYQQSAGVLKNFGGVVNYSYAVPVGDESILAFGINTYFYNSTFDFGKIITVENEPLLQNQKANSLIGLKPGINFGTEFFDFGVSVNNLVLYNLATSEMVKDNQENSYLGHVMYTGYINSYRRFLDDAKFSTLVFVEKKNDATALAANLLLDIPNKAWIQGGYNTLYGFSAGVGITISERFSLGYNYDLGLGDVSELGSSHQFLLAYTFDEYENINITNRVKKQGGSKKPVKKTSTTIALKTKAQKDKENAEKLANAKLERERLAAEAAANAEKNRLANEEAARLKAAEDKAKLEAPVNIQAEKDRLAAEEAARIKAAADKAKAEAAAKAQAEKDRLASEEAARLKAAEKAKSDKARAAAAAKTQAEKDRLAAEEAARLKAAADKAKAEAAAKTQAEKDRLAAEEAARLKAAAEKAKAEAAAKTQAEKDRLAAEEAARLKAAADKAKAEAAAKAQAEKDKLSTEEALRKKLESDESNKAVEAFKKDIETKSNASDELTKSLEAIVKERDADLKEFLLENTLNADGTVRGPKGFVNTKEENAKLENLKSRISLNKVEFDKLIRDFEASNIQRLKEIKAKGISDTDAKPLNDYYQKMLNDLKQKRETFNRLEKEADLKIQKIKDEKEAERLRRIKKADYDSETERNRRNQEYLEGLKKNQEVVGGNDTAPKNKEGESINNPNAIIDIPIIKKLTDVSAGYYLVLKTFSNLEETKAYLSTVISAGGGANVNFFYNLHNSTYYVYIAKADTMGDANQELKAKGTKTYNKNMFIAKVE